MADTYKKLASGTLGTESAPLYTAPVGGPAIVQSILLCNKTAGDLHVTLTAAAVNVVYQHVVPANDTLVLSGLGLILDAEAVIAGLAEAAASVDYYISGLEMA